MDSSYMRAPRWIGIFLLAAVWAPRLLRAGMLDDAPFRVVLPGPDWRLVETTNEPSGKKFFLAAQVSNPSKHLTSMVLESVKLPGAPNIPEPDKAYESFTRNLRQSLDRPGLNMISDTTTNFAGYRARVFTYEITDGDRTIYNVMTAFLTTERGWAITCVGRADQKEAVNEMAGFFQAKGK